MHVWACGCYNSGVMAVKRLKSSVCAVLLQSALACATSAQSSLPVIVRDSGNPYALRASEGEAFVPIGMNRFDIYQGHRTNAGNRSMDAYFDAIAESGVNVLRVFFPMGPASRAYDRTNPSSSFLEPELGVYDEGWVEKLDATFEAAEERGIYLIPVLFNHYFLLHAFEQSPYSTARGGPCATPREWFTNPEAWVYQERYLRTFVSRYANRGVLAWEPINELNGVQVDDSDDRGYRREAVAWFERCVEVIHEEDPHGRLITESLTGDRHWEELFSSPAIDIIQIHTYPDDAYGAVGSVIWYLERVQHYRKPFTIGEFGAAKTSPQRTEVVRDVMWASHLCGGGAWLWTHSYDNYGDITDEELSAIRQLRAFLAEVDCRGTLVPHRQAEIQVTELDGGRAETRIAACDVGEQRLLYVRRRVPGGPLSCRVTEMKPHTLYSVRWFDESTDAFQEPESAQSDIAGILTIETPSFRWGVAALISIPTAVGSSE